MILLLRSIENHACTAWLDESLAGFFLMKAFICSAQITRGATKWPWRRKASHHDEVSARSSLVSEITFCTYMTRSLTERCEHKDNVETLDSERTYNEQAQGWTYRLGHF
jgi:hypothetical protein